MDSTILNAVSTVGFPIVVTLYLLVKFQSSMDNFSRKVDELIIELRRGIYPCQGGSYTPMPSAAVAGHSKISGRHIYN